MLRISSFPVQCLLMVGGVATVLSKNAACLRMHYYLGMMFFSCFPLFRVFVIVMVGVGCVGMGEVQFLRLD